MRELTAEERELRDRRKAGFEQLYNEMLEVLVDFAERLQLPNPPRILAEAERYLEAIDEFMAEQEVLLDDRDWVHARLAYYIGELLVQKFGGCWFLNEIPDSRFFLHYVVGRFNRIKNPNAMVDPFLVADTYLREKDVRSLKDIIAETADELSNA